jgi:hypothetical protein
MTNAKPAMVDDMHGLYLFASEAYEAGRRAGHNEMYAATAGMSFVSLKYEKSGPTEAFHAAEECCKVRQDAVTKFRALKTV